MVLDWAQSWHDLVTVGHWAVHVASCQVNVETSCPDSACRIGLRQKREL